MESRKFVEEQLRLIHERIKFVMIRYEFDDVFNYHIIEVTPLSYFESNKDYIDLEIGLTNLFENLYPKEEIVFVSEDSLLQVNNPCLVLESEQKINHLASFKEPMRIVLDINGEFVLDDDYTYSESFLIAA